MFELCCIPKCKLEKKKAVVFKEKLYNTNNKNLVVTIQLLTSDYNKSDTNCANLEKKKTV